MRKWGPKVRLSTVTLAMLCITGLAGCTSIGSQQGQAARFPFTLAEAHIPIRPSTGVQVGHLYFASGNANAAFKDENGQAYSKLCYDNYAKTAALRDIGAQVTGTEDSDTRTIDDPQGPGLWLDFFGLAKLDAGTTVRTTVQNTHLLQLSPEGRNTVGTELNLTELDAAAPEGEPKDCRETILQRKAANQAVVLVLAAERADRISVVTQSGIGGSLGVGNSVGGSVSGVSGGVRTGLGSTGLGTQKQSSSSTKSNVVFSLLLEEL